MMQPIFIPPCQEEAFIRNSDLINEHLNKKRWVKNESKENDEM